MIKINDFFELNELLYWNYILQKDLLGYLKKVCKNDSSGYRVKQKTE